MKLDPGKFFLYKSFALFGLSERKGSISLQIYRLLVNHGFSITPINPNRSQAAGIECYPTLQESPVKVEAAIVVTNPGISKKVAQQCKDARIKEIWFQYETMDDELKQWCDDNEIDWIQSCVLLHHDGAGFPHNLHRFFYRLFVRSHTR